MSALQEAFDAVRALALTAQDAYARVYVGALPDEDSLCMAISAGRPESTCIGLQTDWSVDMVVNAKHRYQATALDALAEIHRALTTCDELPCGDGWQILSISTSSAPTYLGFEGDQYLYGSGLDVRISIY